MNKRFEECEKKLDNMKDIDELFALWKEAQSYDEYNYSSLEKKVHKESFIKDGIVGKNGEWEKRKKKVLYILKESNSSDEINESKRDLLKLGKDEELFWLQRVVYNQSFLNKKGNLIGARISKLQNYIDNFEPTTEYDKTTLKNISFMNLNKRGGINHSDETIASYTKKYKKFINKQIEILAPDLVICGNTYNLIKKYVYNNEVEELTENVFKTKLNNKYMFFIGVDHPSSRVSNEHYLNNFINKYNIVKNYM